MNLTDFLTSTPIQASAPCRLDMGGTLDISTFHYPMRRFSPCTFNIALDLRTTVRLSAFEPGRVKISSKGFEHAVFAADQLPFAHPLGLMFMVAAYFGAAGVHVQIESASPPQSGLGGSSVAAVALIAALAKTRQQIGLAPALDRKPIALLAHNLESAVAGVPCGIQDQLAAVYGGVNAWFWQAPGFSRKVVVPKAGHGRLTKQLLVAYCGKPHVSADINGQWVARFLQGRDRRSWEAIVRATQTFIEALLNRQPRQAVEAMNQETQLRCEMTPGVLDELGYDLVAAARAARCGARFTGAGAGGCIWALGEPADIQTLAGKWRDLLGQRPAAKLLDAGVDGIGVEVGIRK